MFGRTRAPIEDEMREWIDHSARWILDEFGAEAILDRPVVLPTPEFFPDPYDAGPAGLETLVERVCGYMQVDRSRFRIEIFSDSDVWVGQLLPAFDLRDAGQQAGAAGLYVDPGDGSGYVLAFEEANLPDPAGVVATIAHELCHIHLLGDGRVEQDDEDHEFLTDLLTVFLGLGVFTANSAFQFRQWEDGVRQGWSASRAGYLEEEEFGYALALFAYLRGEARPPWTSHLERNIVHFFKKSARYLAKARPPILPAR